MLVRQKVITATIVTSIAIILLAVTAYILSADRVGREQLAPEISRVLADIFHLQLQHSPDDLLALKALSKSMTQHYQIQEVALYNAENERVIYACTLSCGRNLPEQYSSAFSPDETTFVYTLVHPQTQSELHLVIEAEIQLSTFFIADTVITSLFIVALSTLFLFLLYNLIRHWQKQPYLNLLATIHKIQQQPDDGIRFPLNDADTQRLSIALNDMIILNEEREEVFRSAREKAESARVRAIRLSNETRHINEQLAQEITIRRSIENQLKHTQSFLDNIIDSMPSALFALDNDGFIIQCNQQAADWLDCERAPLTGKRLSHFISAAEVLHDLLNTSSRKSVVSKKERVLLDFPSGSIPTDIVVYPLKDSGLQGLVVRIDDISQRQRMEEIIVQTEKMKSVGGLAAGMAHEINNPLGAILQGVQNIIRRISTDNSINQEVAANTGLNLNQMHDYLTERQVIRFLNNIQDAGQRAASIVSNMLQFSRGSQQKQTFIAVDDLISRTLGIARSDLDLRQINIELNYEENLPELSCIPSEIEQVILNLMQNAAQALNDHPLPDTDHTPTITISSYRKQESIVIKVADNGPGMDEETSRRVFEPFYTTKDIGSGTGLGLSVSYFIITAHHKGQLTVETSTGNGASFFIQLPLSTEHLPD